MPSILAWHVIISDTSCLALLTGSSIQWCLLCLVQGHAEELAHLDRNYWRLKRLQSMRRGTSEHDQLAKRLVAKKMLKSAYLEPVFSIQLQCGRRTAVLLDNGQISVNTDVDSLEHAQMPFR